MAGSGAQPPIDANPTNRQSEPSRRDAADYIASLLEGLRLVALQSNMSFLAYLLSVALEEAKTEKIKHD